MTQLMKESRQKGQKNRRNPNRDGAVKSPFGRPPRKSGCPEEVKAVKSPGPVKADFSVGTLSTGGRAASAKKAADKGMSGTHRTRPAAGRRLGRSLPKARRITSREKER